MKYVVIMYAVGVFLLFNFMILPALISSSDSILTFTGFMLLLTEVGLAIKLLATAIKSLKGGNNA
jgi:hypothetical protein